MSLFSQEKYKQHTVSKGETISEIAKKYKVKPSAIYELNPDAVNGIKLKTVLLIPTNSPKSKASSSTVNTANLSLKNHEVLPKETLYGISKQYQVTIEDLYKSNPSIEKEGLKIGQNIKIPQTDIENSAVSKSVVVEAPKVSKKNDQKEETVLTPKVEEKKVTPSQGIQHEVLAKESLYSISKKYGIKLADLEKANPELGTKSIKVGQKINVPIKEDANSSVVVEKVTEKKEVQTEKTPSDNNKSKQIDVAQQVGAESKKQEYETNHEVLAKETKYGIAKQYGLTIAELEKQNPNIEKKLLVGSVLKIRSSKEVETKSLVVETVVVKEESGNKDSVINPNRTFDAAFVDQLISKASENIGTKYRSGGTTTDGFDCSGLMCYTFSSYDIKLPRSSVEMASYGSKIDAQNAQKGDLIFFKTRGSGRINHVGMVVEVLEGEIKFIHSATHGGVIISSTKESYYERNLVQVNRVL
jgi:cell wall-associated NlpC family hydrolase